MQSKTVPKISIIVLNYNSWRDTIPCLESVFNIDHQDFHVILVDNGSTDNSLAYLKKWATGEVKYNNDFPDHPYFKELHTVKKPLVFTEYERREFLKKSSRVENLYEEKFIVKTTMLETEVTQLVIIDTKENLGFAGGNNVGIRFALHYFYQDYIMILNNDTVVQANLVSKLVDVFTLQKGAGICGPVEYSYQEPYSIQSAGGRFNVYTGRNKIFKNSLQQIQAVDWIVGSCMLIRKDLFYEVGYFDERFFLYVEEADYAFRVNKRGYRIFVTPETCIWHKGGTKGGRTFDEVYYFYAMRNRVLFALKHLKFYQVAIFIVNHFKKLISFSLRDFFVNRRFNFLKRLRLIKEGFALYKQKEKEYTTVK